MTLQEKIKHYGDMFERKEVKRGHNEPETIIIFKDNATETLKDSVREAHGDHLPSNWIFNIYSNILDNLAGYTINSADDIDNARAEIVDGLVNPYTADLTAWLASNINNVYYLTEAADQYEVKDGFKLLATAQSIAIDEIFGYVYNLLTNK